MNRNFLRKRWLDFRNGHSIYLAFFLTFANFSLITYNFAIKQLPFLNGLFDNMVVFVLFFISIYVPVAMALGYWHRRNQYSVENEALLQENWVWAWTVRFQIRQIQGKVTPEETKEMIKYLESILKRQKKEFIIKEKTDVDLKNTPNEVQK